MTGAVSTGPIPLAKAQALLLDNIAPLSAETLPVAAARGHYLAEAMIARRTQPAADLSAMDGYAMKAGEEGPWQVVGESAAGHPYPGHVGPGEAVRISTGAMLPDGAEAILLQENAARDGQTVSLNGNGSPAQRHIRRAGFDFRDGATLLPPGTLIGAAQMALAVTAGNALLRVHRKPALAIIDSGDELAADPENCAPHQIPASNSVMLAALCSSLAGNINRIGPVPDDLDALIRSFEAAENADVIVTSGGASVGDHDLIRPALKAWGARIGFWKVAMKPGKPLLVARRGRQIVLGLPGNPVSSYVTACFFLLPLLRRLAGDASPLPRPIMLPLGADTPPGGSRLEFLRARIEDGAAVPVMEQDSSALMAMAASTALIERPVDAPAARKGMPVPVYLLPSP